MTRQFEAADRERISSQTRDQLREDLRSRGLAVAGTKRELIERLTEAVERLGGAFAADESIGTASTGAHDTTAADGGHDEVFGDVRRTARQLAGVLSDRGVPVDRVVTAFRAYAEEFWPVDTEAQQKVAKDDRGLVERLLSAIEHVVDRADTITTTDGARSGADAVLNAADAATDGLMGTPGQVDEQADVLERLLDEGLGVAGDIQINLLDIERITLKVRLLLASPETANEMGIDWWKHDPFLTGHDNELGRENAVRGRAPIRDQLRPTGATGSAGGNGDGDRGSVHPPRVAPEVEKVWLDETAIDEMTRDELRAELAARGLYTSGIKDVLRQRLLEALDDEWVDAGETLET